MAPRPQEALKPLPAGTAAARARAGTPGPGSSASPGGRVIAVDAAEAVRRARVLLQRRARVAAGRNASDSSSEEEDDSDSDDEPQAKPTQRQQQPRRAPAAAPPAAQPAKPAVKEAPAQASASAPPPGAPPRGATPFDAPGPKPLHIPKPPRAAAPPAASPQAPRPPSAALALAPEIGTGESTRRRAAATPLPLAPRAALPPAPADGAEPPTSLPSGLAGAPRGAVDHAPRASAHISAALAAALDAAAAARGDGGDEAAPADDGRGGDGPASPVARSSSSAGAGGARPFAGLTPAAVSDDTLRVLLRPGPGAEPLTLLDVGGCCGVSPPMVVAVAAAAGASLALVRCTGGRAWSADAAEALCRSCPGLRSFEVDVRAAAVTPQLCRVLSGSGEARPCRARALTFRGLLRSPAAAAELAEALGTAGALRRCLLRGRVHPAGLPPLLAALAANEGIEDLTLASLGIGASEALFFAARLAEAAPHLRTCTLRDEPLGDMGAQALASGFLATTAASALTCLELTRCNLRASGAEALASALGGGSAAARELRRLVLAGNALRSTDALQAIGELVAHAPRLAELDLSCNGIAAADNARPLFRALELPPLPPLRRLVLRGNRLGNEGAKLLARGPLRNGTLLESIDLADAGIGSDGGDELAAAARAAPRLRLLELEYNELGHVGTRALEGARSASLTVVL